MFTAPVLIIPPQKLVVVQASFRKRCWNNSKSGERADRKEIRISRYEFRIIVRSFVCTASIGSRVISHRVWEKNGYIYRQRYDTLFVFNELSLFFISLSLLVKTFSFSNKNNNKFPFFPVRVVVFRNQFKRVREIRMERKANNFSLLV